jgi:hypothetical protein
MSLKAIPFSYFLWVHRQPVLSAHSVHSLVLLSQEQVPSLHVQHLPNRLRFTLQQKIALAAQVSVKSQDGRVV